VSEVLAVHGHRERDGDALGAEVGQGLGTQRAEVGAAQGLLAGLLDAIELQVDLQLAGAEDLAERGAEGGFLGEADAVGVQQQEVDLRVRLDPPAEL